MNEHGLKYGNWHDAHSDCFYKIIPFSYYDTIGFDDRRLAIRRYNGEDTSTENIKVYVFFGDSISVRDGEAKFHDSAGNLSQTIIYQVGIVGSMIGFSKTAIRK